MHHLNNQIKNKNNFYEIINEINYEKTLNDYILLNKNEIIDYIKDIDGFVDLLNITYSLIKKVFPYSKLYMALEEIYDCYDPYLILIYVVNKNGSFEENSKLDDVLFHDFVRLKNLYPEAWMKLNYIVEEDDEYYELWRKGIIDNE